MIELETQQQFFKECVDKWSQTPYLDGIIGTYQKSVIASTLEAQSQAIELDPSILGPLSKEQIFELIQKTFRGFYLLDLVSFQPMRGPADYCHILRFRKVEDQPEIKLMVEKEDCVSKTKRLKIESDFKKDGWLDKLADDLRNEITTEILKDLSLNVGTKANTCLVGEKEKYEYLYFKIIEISSIIYRKTLRGGANWIVCGKDIASILTTNWAIFGERTLEHQHYLGTMLSRWKCYVDPQLEPNEMLLGYRGESYLDSGYFFNPYVFLKVVPIEEQKYGFMRRYSKKMPREGAKFYAKLTIEDS